MAEINLLSGHYHSAPKTDANVRTKRLNNGECADCGIKTHEIVKNILGRPIKRIPLTKEGFVLEGRCLLCHPLPTTLQGQVPSVHSLPQARLEEQASHKPSEEMKPSKTQHGLQSTKPTLSTSATTGSVTCNHDFPSCSSSCCDITREIDTLRETSNTKKAFRACERLNVACMNPHNRQMDIIKANGIQVIISAMQFFQSSFDVQNRGIQALGQLSKLGSSILAKHDGFQAIVRGMDLFWDGNSSAGMSAMKTMSKSDSSLFANGGIQELIRLLKKTSDNWDAAENAVISLYNLAKEKRFRIIIAETDTINVILSLIRCHANNPYFIADAFYALAEIGRHEERYANLLVREGLIDTIEQTTKACPAKSHWNRVKKAMSVLSNQLSRFPSTHDALRQLDISSVGSIVQKQGKKEDIEFQDKLKFWE
jgi:hypothetical protein